MKKTDNLRISALNALVAPALLTEQYPLTESIADHILKSRKTVSDILQGKDERLIVVVGPCSIHDPEAALDYAKKLKSVLGNYKSELQLIMRVYFEKPRTTVGWKGLINDPNLNDSFEINHGLMVARKLLLNINNLGVATGSEFLDTIIPQYISDLTTWSAIGARTVESQIHRELASGLSMPLGFKNSTTGSIQVALDAVKAAGHQHHFLGISKEGFAAIVSTLGNQDCHIILRGGKGGPNFDEKSVEQAAELLKSAGLTPRLMVDMSHGNSNKDHRRQQVVAKALCEQLIAGSSHLMGVMIESNLLAGNQQLKPDKIPRYGQSITDACIDWDETIKLLDELKSAVAERKKTK